MRYLTGEEALIMHAAIIDETGGRHGVRELELLRSIFERPKASFGGSEMYPGVHEKAAAYLEAFAQYHVFMDGNKRTSLAAAARFLFQNGYRLTATNDEAAGFVLEVVEKKLQVAVIADWLASHSEVIS